MLFFLLLLCRTYNERELIDLKEFRKKNKLDVLKLLGRLVRRYMKSLKEILEREKELLNKPLVLSHCA